MSGVLNFVGAEHLINAQSIQCDSDAVDPINALSTITCTAGGAIDCTASPSGATTDFQLVKSGDINTLEIFVTVISGTVSTGTTGAWIALSGATWTVSRTIAGTKVFTGTYAIRRATTGFVYATGVSFTSFADVAP